MTADDELANSRRLALPFDGQAVAEFYLRARPGFDHREDFIELFFEAYNSYVAGAPRASMIVAAEGLLRAVYDSIVQLSRVGVTGSITRRRRVRGKRDFSLSAATRQQLFTLADELSFCEAIQVLQESRVLPDNLIHLMFVIKDLRNRAAHTTLPLLDDWDPDEPRPPEMMSEVLWKEEFAFPEGYRFVPSHERSDWFTIDIRKYESVSLRSLDTADRFAAIQQLLVIDAIKGLAAARTPGAPAHGRRDAG